MRVREMGSGSMPVAIVAGVPPAYEIMVNFSGLHMDMWGEMEMVGTIMDRDIKGRPVRLDDGSANAEIVIEGHVNPETFKVGDVTSPSVQPAAFRECP